MSNGSTGLVLEGGGFRGIYSAGVLDCFLENNIHLPYVIGVSMGACNAANYISRQVGRSLNVPYAYIGDKRYISYQRFLFQGELFGMDFMFKEIPKKLIPFDFDTFYSSTQKLIVCATNCRTGKPVYMDDFSVYDFMEALKASSSLPFVQKMVEIKGMQLLDGGISDSIPVQKAFDDGCTKAIVVLTRPLGYRKQPSSLKLAAGIRYRKFPKFKEALINRHIMYNATLDQIEQLEKDDKIFVIRPDEKIPIGRVEKDREKLQEAYEIGYQQCKLLVADIRKFTEHN